MATHISAVMQHMEMDARIDSFALDSGALGISIGDVEVFIPSGEDGVLIAAAIEKAAGDLRIMAIDALHAVEAVD